MSTRALPTLKSHIPLPPKNATINRPVDWRQAYSRPWQPSMPGQVFAIMRDLDRRPAKPYRTGAGPMRIDAFAGGPASRQDHLAACIFAARDGRLEIGKRKRPVVRQREPACGDRFRQRLPYRVQLLGGLGSHPMVDPEPFDHQILVDDVAIRQLGAIRA